MFHINPNYLIKKEERGRWINVLKELEQYDYEEIRGEFEAIQRLAPDKDRYYYLESVRRNLMVKRNDKYKRQGPASNVKEALRGLFQ